MTDIRNEQTKAKFTDEMDRIIRQVVEKTKEYEGIDADMGVSVVITDNETIRELNRTYRDKDSVTDVLSFPLYDEDGYLDDEELGDIVISLERAYSQAEEYGHGIIREVAFLTAHSMLHLLGYDHENGETEMYEKQEEILNLLGITR